MGQSIGKLLVLWLAVAEVVFLIVILTTPDETGENGIGQRTPESEFVQHENRLVSYSVTHPRSWKAEDEGSLTTAFSPDRHAVVSIGVGPDGSLLGVADAIVSLARSRYRRLEIDRARTDFIDGNLAIMREGTAFNAAGIQVFWFAAAIETVDQNFAITAFWSENHGLRRQVLKVIKSFDTEDD